VPAHARRRSTRPRRHRTRVALGAGFVLVAAGAAVAFLELPRTNLAASTRGIVRLEHEGIPEHVVAVSATTNGRTIDVVDRGGRILPNSPIPAGTSITVRARLATPSWLRWLLGSEATVSATVVAPSARLLDPIVISSSGAVRGYFSEPVSVVRITTATDSQVIRLARPSRRITVVSATSGERAGIVSIAAAVAPWETLDAPSQLTFFHTTSSAPIAIVSPGTTDLDPQASITIALSQPVQRVFGSANPSIAPVIQGADPVTGTWSRPTPYTLTFTPSTSDFWPGESFTLSLPAPVTLATTTGSLGATTHAITLQGAPPSVLRIQQLLAQLGYLPLSFTPQGPQPTTLAAQAQAAVDPPAGSFAWRWAMPAPLENLWQPGVDTVMTQGAIMTFEHTVGLDDNGLANPLLWPTLIHDALTHTLDPHPYAYILVSKVRPETLWLYVNGQVTLTSPVNTGIAGLNTPVGTWPIYLRYVENYMSGTNPNGTPYHDLVHWINYFTGSVAVHGFQRASYGFPQSLGCVELPVATAGVLYPQVHIGTLVTVLPS